MAYRIIFRGRVQGVWFRANSRKKALSLGLNGFVRNLDDGSVEMVVSGPKPKVDALISMCHELPDVIVEDFTMEEADAEEFDSFKIL